MPNIISRGLKSSKININIRRKGLIFDISKYQYQNCNRNLNSLHSTIDDYYSSITNALDNIFDKYCSNSNSSHSIKLNVASIWNSILQKLSL